MKRTILKKLTACLCLCAVFGLAWLAVHLFQAG